MTENLNVILKWLNIFLAGVFLSIAGVIIGSGLIKLFEYIKIRKVRKKESREERERVREYEKKRFKESGRNVNSKIVIKGEKKDIEGLVITSLHLGDIEEINRDIQEIGRDGIIRFTNFDNLTTTFNGNGEE